PRSSLFPYTTLFRSVVLFNVTAERQIARLDLGPGQRAYDVQLLLAGVVLRHGEERVTLEALEQVPVFLAHGTPARQVSWRKVSRSEEHTSELQSREN